MIRKVKKEVLSKVQFFLLLFALVFIDLYSKNIAIENLSYQVSKETFIPFIDLLLIYNTGIAFGIFDEGVSYASYVLLAITIIICFYLIYLFITEENNKKKIALLIITAGALGNIIDRAGDGQVTDFLHLKILNTSFFIFNLADAFITLGALLIIYFEIIYRPKND